MNPPAPLKEEDSSGGGSSTPDKKPAAPENTSAGVDFSEVYSLLTKHQQSSNSLLVPIDDPTLNQILDVLTVQGIEKLARRRWEDMASRFGGESVVNKTSEKDTPDEEEGPSEEEKWLSLQQTPYKKYEELHKLEVEGMDDDDFQESSKTTPNHLTPERVGILRKAGVAMNKWEIRLRELKRYHKERGNCEVPIEYPGGLGLWCATQKVAYRFDKATMPQSRIDALDAMGFVWQSQKRKDSWSRYFDDLVEYIRQHGTSHVSIYDENYTQLGSWVKRQRAEYKKYMEKGRAKSQMTKERIDKLESIGFAWRLKPDKITWDDRYEALKKFKAQHGHCRPSQNEDKDLNKWTRYQRLNYQYFSEGKPSRLNQEKVNKLLAIGIHDPAPSSSCSAEETDVVNAQIAATQMPVHIANFNQASVPFHPFLGDSM